jgi:DNA-directed RNA polymerase subunit F
MRLEEIEGIEKVNKIKAGLKELTEAREINIPEATKILSNIQKEYNALLKKNGEEYCNKNCPDVPNTIKRISTELRGYSF